MRCGLEALDHGQLNKSVMLYRKYWAARRRYVRIFHKEEGKDEASLQRRAGIMTCTEGTTVI